MFAALNYVLAVYMFYLDSSFVRLNLWSIMRNIQFVTYILRCQPQSENHHWAAARLIIVVIWS